jgi:diguanylate cyclase (GGDEF)-like protein
LQASSKSIPYLLAIAAWTVGMLAYYTFWHPSVTARVFLATLMLPIMLAPSVAMLLRCRQTAIITATRVLAGLYLFFMLSCWLSAVSILRGARPQSGASWGGAVLIAGVALCFLWMDLLRMRSELESQAMTDHLTGLLNRRAIEILAERELSRAARNQTALTLLTIDIDHFKQVNDQYGHFIGDQALLAVAAVLRRTLRTHDLAVRSGGDEFVVLLTESSPNTAQNIADRVQEDVASLELKDQSGHPFAISVTIGRYTMRPTVLSAYPDLVHASDMDLYSRKKQRINIQQLPPAAAVKNMMESTPTS